MPFFSWKIISIFSSLGTSALVPFMLPSSMSVFKSSLDKSTVDPSSIVNASSESKVLNPTVKAEHTPVNENSRGGRSQNNLSQLGEQINVVEKTQRKGDVSKKFVDPNMMRYWGIEGENVAGIIQSGTYTTNLACCNTRIVGPFNRFLINSQLNNYELKYSSSDSQLLFLQFPNNFGNSSEFLSKYSSSWIQTTWSSTFSSWPIKWAAQKLKNGASSNISYQALKENVKHPSLGSESIIKQEIVDQIELPEDGENIFLVEVSKNRLSSLLTSLS